MNEGFGEFLLHEVESELGKGTKFVIQLPLDREWGAASTAGSNPGSFGKRSAAVVR
ncbi:MAG: hypothetical protein GY866_42330 [Proteobacteria bacterium]|nr:hypothetical protein [Pseudomonadota bacterium]